MEENTLAIRIKIRKSVKSRLMVAATVGFGFKALYNGNVAAMAVNVPKIGEPLLYTYTYDQLNRITKLFTYNGLNAKTNSWNISALQDYCEQVSYDPNGNFLLINGMEMLPEAMTAIPEWITLSTVISPVPISLIT